MTEKQHSTSKTVAKIEARHGAESAIVRSDGHVIPIHRCRAHGDVVPAQEGV